jgi:hypothetical protein
MAVPSDNITDVQPDPPFALVEFLDKDKSLAIVKRSDVCEISEEKNPDNGADCTVLWRKQGKRKPTKHAAVLLRFGGN